MFLANFGRVLSLIVALARCLLTCPSKSETRLSFAAAGKLAGKWGKNSRASALCNFCALKARWGKFAAIVLETERKERGIVGARARVPAGHAT